MQAEKTTHMYPKVFRVLFCMCFKVVSSKGSSHVLSVILECCLTHPNNKLCTSLQNLHNRIETTSLAQLPKTFMMVLRCQAGQAHYIFWATLPADCMTGPAKAYLLVLLLRLVACEDDSGTEIAVPRSVSKRPDLRMPTKTLLSLRNFARTCSLGVCKERGLTLESVALLPTSLHA